MFNNKDVEILTLKSKFLTGVVKVRKLRKVIIIMAPIRS